MDLSQGKVSAAVPGGVLCPHGEQIEERQSVWASHTLQLSRAAAQYLTSALPWVMIPPHWDRLCPQVVEAPKMQFVPDAFQSGREAQRAPFSACACDPCHQHRWRFIPLYELRALIWAKEPPLKHSLVSLVKTWEISGLPWFMLWLLKRHDMTSSLE